MAVAAVLLVCALAAPASAQEEKPTLTVDDYGQWERLGGATLSPDGRWLAFGISRVNDEASSGCAPSIPIRWW